ncbi:leucine-rich repeat domain-containing protein [Adlercreutzia sp. R21]|uniref:leucine-rich repeat domain-containing protein n=1 Tax=Adlercreutzia wanghongyangiae TaxID=3111451 RepID=UPI002DB5BDAE|nr:leucine-rich repeat domain-containing protein [Adlercreutzia sp. R21]MEC4183407.1 leucine-rich repeat domain-containing protein [Adlercreutzia sp. R21]
MPDPLDVDLSILDFSSVEYFAKFPPTHHVLGYRKARRSRATKYRAIRVHPEFTFGEIQGGDAPIELAAPSSKYEIANGALYDKPIKTLLYCPCQMPANRALRLPASVEIVGENAFSRVEALELRLPEGLREIVPMAFFLSSIQRVVVPRGAILGSRRSSPTGFFGAFSFFCGKEVILPEGLEEIPPGTFSGSKLESCCIPSSVKYVGKMVFDHCAHLSLVVPDTVKEIAPGAFEDVAAVSLPAGRGTRGNWRQGIVCVVRDGYGGFSSAWYSPTGYSFGKKEVVDLFKSKKRRTFHEKIRIALTRLCTIGDAEIGSDDEMLDLCEDYVLKNCRRAREEFSESHDIVCQALLRVVGPSIRPSLFADVDPKTGAASVILAARRGNETVVLELLCCLEGGGFSPDQEKSLVLSLAKRNMPEAARCLAQKGFAPSDAVLAEVASRAAAVDDVETVARIFSFWSRSEKYVNVSHLML